MVEWVKNLMQSLGYVGIAFLMFLENIFPPIPSEVIMPLGGFTSAQSDLSLLGVVIAGTIGSVLGQLPLYALGAWYGTDRLAEFADKYCRWLTVCGDDVRRASTWFDKYGSAAIFFCRFIPGIRTLISIPAGIQRMNILTFLGYSTLGMGLWAAILAYLGRILGANYGLVEDYLGPVPLIVFGILAVAAVFFVMRRRKAQSQSNDRAAQPERNQRAY